MMPKETLNVLENFIFLVFHFIEIETVSASYIHSIFKPNDGKQTSSK